MRINKSLLALSRQLHVYVSMALLTLMIFFSITGITLNHPEWFASHQGEVVEGDFSLKSELLAPKAQGKLIDYLFEQGQLNGHRLEIERDEEELFITDKGPGSHLSITIDLQTGQAYKESTDYGYWALLNDLHKGRNSGIFWRFIIDVSAVMMIFFTITGFILALSQRRVNRTMGLSLITSLLLLLGYVLWV
ncbi:PepSY-associated TM helix domain-containing protein [Shewanella frigidimarina]|uniref:PepSY-associated TM helix domain-containing protein n=1 Tax=Shewanella frigidimarina TaxID=56812 RepID=UPI003D792372